MKTHYDILGVDNSASVTEIKRAYRQLAKRYHPDMNPNNANAQELFLQVQAAYEILSDTNKRYAYDKQLSGDYFHTSSPAFDHYCVVSASKTHVKLNDEVFITFTYSGEGRIFRQPDFRGFHVIGKPFIPHKPPPEPRRVVHLAHRQIFPEELRLLLATSGLELESLTGNFRSGPLAPGVDAQTAIARRSQ